MFKTVGAAEALMASGNRDTWAMADAIAEDVPVQQSGPKALAEGDSPPARGVNYVMDKLEEIAQTLCDLGITTPNGDDYTASSLGNMRETAMSWPKNTRHLQAAYRTHQEAGGSSNPNREVLAALCKVAQGKRVTRPTLSDKTEVDEDAWKQVVILIRNKMNRPKPPNFLVSANDLRRALKRKVNTPPTNDLQGLLDALVDIEKRLLAFISDLPDIEATDEWEDTHRGAVVTTLTRVRDAAGMTISVIEDAVDEDELNAWMAEDHDQG